MIILDNLDLQYIEIMRVLHGAPSEGLTAEAIKSSGDNLVSAENVSKRLQKLSDLKLVIPLENTHYRLHLDGENLFWGKGELWSKFLHIVYVGSLEMGLTLETIQSILGQPGWKFKSALEILRPRGFLHRNDIKSMGGKEFHLWELTPEGKKYVSDEFSAEQTRSSAFKTQWQRNASAKTKEDILNKLHEAQMWSVADGDVGALALTDVISAIEQLPTEQEKMDKILEIVENLKNMIEKQNDVLRNTSSLISKLYQDGEINKDTFNRLDEFLHDWLDSSFGKDD